MNHFFEVEVIVATLIAFGLIALTWYLRWELVKLGRRYRLSEDSCSTLRTLVTAGEKTERDLKLHLASALLDCELLRDDLRKTQQQNLALAQEILKAREYADYREDDFFNLTSSFSLALNKTGLEVFLAKLQSSPAYRLPDGLELLTDEVGNVLYLPGTKAEYPRRAFVYVCNKGSGDSISRKALHAGQHPEIQNARVTFVLDEWLSVGEVTIKLRRAAESLLKEKANVP